MSITALARRKLCTCKNFVSEEKNTGSGIRSYCALRFLLASEYEIHGAVIADNVFFCWQTDCSFPYSL